MPPRLRHSLALLQKKITLSLPLRYRGLSTCPLQIVLHALQCFCIAKTTHSQPIGLAKLHVVVRPHALVSTSGMNEALVLQNETEAMAFQTTRGGLSQRGI